VSGWYYLMAQLPALSSDTEIPLPVTEDYFSDLCARFMDKKSLKILKSLSLEPPRENVRTGSAFVDSWYGWERQLRLSLAVIRAGRLNKSFSTDSLSFPADVQQTARTACGFDSPLEAEVFLNNARMDMISRLSPSDGFSTDAVFAYALKLKLLVRIRKFSEEAGVSSYRKIYEKILESSVRTA